MKKNTKEKKKRKDAIEAALSYKSRKEEIEFLSEIVNADFVGEIKRSLAARNITDTDVAKKLKVSKSYISQIFNGTRMVNISFITMIRRNFTIPLELIDTSRYFSSVTIISARSTEIIDLQNKQVASFYTPIGAEPILQIAQTTDAQDSSYTIV